MIYPILPTIIALFVSLPYTGAEELATTTLVATVYQHPDFRGQSQDIPDTNASNESCLNFDQAFDKQITSYLVRRGGFCQFFVGQGCLPEEYL